MTRVYGALIGRITAVKDLGNHKSELTVTVQDSSDMRLGQVEIQYIEEE